MRTRLLSATATSIMPREGRPRRRHTISRFTLAARQSIQEEMSPLIAQAKKAGLILYLSCQQRSFDPVALQKEMKAGRYCMGSNWWQLREAIS